MKQRKLSNWLFWWITTPVLIFLIASFALSSLIIKKSIDAWFRPVVKSAIEEAESIALSYSLEKENNLKNVLKSLKIAISKNFQGEHSQLLFKFKLKKFMEDFLNACNLQEIIISTRHGEYVAKITENEKTQSVKFPSWIFQFLEDTPNVFAIGNNLYGIIKLKSEPEDLFLIIVKPLDKKLRRKIQETKKATDFYKKSLLEQAGTAKRFLLISLSTLFLCILIILLISIKLSRRITIPISRLVKNAEQISKGESANFDLKYGIFEIKFLGKTMNNMILKLKKQQSKLEDSYEKLNHSKNLIEKVLKSIPSGTVLSSKTGQVKFANDQTKTLFGKVTKDNHLKEITKGKSKFPVKVKEQNKTLMINKIKDGNETLWIIDDITHILEKEKQLAFEKIVQKIAHEIKNPLTPIRLSAQAIGMKESGNKIHSSIILRNVDQINNLISSFYKFANLPKPIKSKGRLDLLISQIIKEMNLTLKNIKFNLRLEKVEFNFDEKLIYQALSNIILNANEALEKTKSPIVKISLLKKGDKISLKIEDNGPNWPEGNLENWLAPYKTNKNEPGHGLGLAICNKIIQEHDGSMQLQRGEEGAVILINF